MQYLSIFQLLPPHAVKMIVDDVVGNMELLSSGEPSNPLEFRERLLPLLSVCHNFRAFVHALLCEHYKIEFNSCYRDYNNNLLWTSWVKSDGYPPTSFELRKPGYPAHHFAKKLRLCFDAWSIYTGWGTEVLSSSPNDGCTFAMVREITFDIFIASEIHKEYNLSSDDSDDDEYSERSRYDKSPKRRTSYPPDTVTNIAAFVQRIKEMAPNVRVVFIKTDCYVDTLLLIRCDHTTDLTRQLYDLSKTRTAIMRGCRVLVEYLGGNLFCNLVHVEYKTRESSRITSLVRRNAQTLRHLDLTMGGAISSTNLIRDLDGGGDWVEYPCLHTLTLNTPIRLSRARNDTVSTAVLFPSLRRLSIRKGYRFEDDVLFRGNAATLEYLRIEVNVNTIALFKSHNVFTPTSHPRLHRVRIVCNWGYSERGFNRYIQYLQLALTIAPGVSVRGIHNLTKLGKEPGLFSSCTNIKNLSLPDTHLTIWDAMATIKSLPLLSNLITHSLLLGDIPQEVVAADELPDYVRSTYAPMGEQFRYWRIVGESREPHEMVAACIQILALVCPNFVVRPHWLLRPYSLFMDDIRKQIDERNYNQQIPPALCSVPD
ncbi:hypothetical protein GGI21_000487 [Coemansia aciculifera]|nr:hypothetical protein GGI21_000487 [Coemansia aciculifera]